MPLILAFQGHYFIISQGQIAVVEKEGEMSDEYSPSHSLCV